MHDCPECGQACCCDGEDHWNDLAADECVHQCEEDLDDDDLPPRGCTCLEVYGENPACPHHGRGTEWEEERVRC